MGDIWTLVQPPMWLHFAFVSGKIGGLLATNPSGDLSILWAVDPCLDVLKFARRLPGSDVATIETEVARFTIDREKHELRLVHA